MSLHLALGRVTAGSRRFLARHRLIRWIPIVVCCGGFVFAVHARTQQLDATRARWADTRTVWAAEREHRPGDEITARSVELPIAAVPDGAVAEVPAGSVARQRLTRGEVVTDGDLAGAGPLALVPDGHRALAVRESIASGAQIGERVDVAADGIVIAPDALVVGLTDDAVLVSVAVADAPVVALASDAGVTLLRGQG